MSKEFINPEGLSVYLEQYGGVTEHSKRYYEEHKDEVGELLGVVILKTGDCEWRTYVIGSLGYIQMDGFSFGYNGEGSRGLAWLIERVTGKRVEDAVSLSFYVFGEWEVGAGCIQVPTERALEEGMFKKSRWQDLKRRYAH